MAVVATSLSRRAPHHQVPGSIDQDRLHLQRRTEFHQDDVVLVLFPS
jgi:hypothetical protein